MWFNVSQTKSCGIWRIGVSHWLQEITTEDDKMVQIGTILQQEGRKCFPCGVYFRFWNLFVKRTASIPFNGNIRYIFIDIILKNINVEVNNSYFINDIIIQSLLVCNIDIVSKMNYFCLWIKISFNFQITLIHARVTTLIGLWLECFRNWGLFRQTSERKCEQLEVSHKTCKVYRPILSHVYHPVKYIVTGLLSTKHKHIKNCPWMLYQTKCKIT